MSSKPNIKILIACHKPSELPKNDLLLPIQVGAANAKADLGLQRDDDGEDNISAKNSGYCELTAIYWAWKNLDADYYGLFHYRRFYSFADEKIPVSKNSDGGDSIQVKALSPKIFHQYGLDDPEKIHRVVDGTDIITHDWRQTKDMFNTLEIPGNTVYDHFKYHGGTHVKISDIDAMIAEVKHSFPEVAPYFNEYIYGPNFRGYNMFIMRKKYFFDMCNFEFTVLKNLEAKINPSLDERSITNNRIYGYLAEMLTDGYIYYLDKTVKNLNHQYIQKLFAEKTGPITSIKPIKNSVPVIIDFTTNNDSSSYYLATSLYRIIKSNHSKLDIIVAYNNNIPDSIMEYIKQLSCDNVSVRTFDFSTYLDILSEEYDKPTTVDFRLIAPHILPDYDKAILLTWNTWVKTDLSELYKTDINNNTVAAAQNSLDLGCMVIANANQRVNYINKLKNEHGYTVNIKNFFNPCVMVMNFTKLRNKVNVEQAIESCNTFKNYPESVKFNVLIDDCKILPQTYNYHINTDYNWSYINYVISWYAPIYASKEWYKLGSDYKIGQYYPDGPDHYCAKFAIEFYTIMRETPAWPLFMLFRDESRTSRVVEQVRLSWRHRLFPTGSRRRKFVKNLLPNGSKRRAVIEKVYRKIIKC